MSNPLTGVLVVLTNPVPGPGNEEDYNRWYNEVHLPEVVATDGIENAQRFKLDSVQAPGTPTTHQYLATYGISYPPEQFMEYLVGVGYELPESFDASYGRLATWCFVPVTDVVGERPESPERVLLALSGPNPGGDAEYNAWYNEHLDELVALKPFLSAQRFKLTANQGPEDILKPSDHEYCAIYDIATSGEELFAAIAQAGFQTPDAFDTEHAQFLLFKAITPMMEKEEALAKVAAAAAR